MLFIVIIIVSKKRMKRKREERLDDVNTIDSSLLFVISDIGEFLEYSSMEMYLNLLVVNKLFNVELNNMFNQNRIDISHGNVMTLNTLVYILRFMKDTEYKYNQINDFCDKWYGEKKRKYGKEIIHYLKSIEPVILKMNLSTLTLRNQPKIKELIENWKVNVIFLHKCYNHLIILNDSNIMHNQFLYTTDDIFFNNIEIPLKYDFKFEFLDIKSNNITIDNTEYVFGIWDEKHQFKQIIKKEDICNIVIRKQKNNTIITFTKFMELDQYELNHFCIIEPVHQRNIQYKMNENKGKKRRADYSLFNKRKTEYITNNLTLGYEYILKNNTNFNGLLSMNLNVKK